MEDRTVVGLRGQSGLDRLDRSGEGANLRFGGLVQTVRSNWCLPIWPGLVHCRIPPLQVVTLADGEEVEANVYGSHGVVTSG